MFPTYGTTQFGEHLPRNEGIYGTLSNTQTISHTITSLCMCLLSLIDHCNAAILQTFIAPFYTYGITDCYDVLLQGHNENGVYSLQINNATSSVDVFCDMETDGEGWTVLLKRQDGSVDFYRMG